MCYCNSNDVCCLVGVGASVRFSVDVKQDKSTDMDMGKGAPVVVEASLAFAAHTTVVLANWSHSLGQTSTRQL